MALAITDRGHANRISNSPDAIRQLNGAIVLNGSNNVLEIEEGCRWLSLSIQLGSDCHVLIGRGCPLGQLLIFARNNGRTSIGERCIINGFVRLLLHKPASLTLGADCLLAGFVDISVREMHSIVDLATGAQINPRAIFR